MTTLEPLAPAAPTRAEATALGCLPGSSVRILAVEGALDLPRVIGAHRVGGDASIRLTAAAAWRATHTPDGPATLRVRQQRGSTGAPGAPGAPGSTVVVEAWGPGAAWALAGADELLGLHDDGASFAPPPGLIRDQHRRHPGLRFGRSRAIVEALVPTILEQKVTSMEAHRSWRALVHRHGTLAPGPDARGLAGRSVVDGGLWLRPDPAVLAQLGYAAFHQLGVERRRADVIGRVCERASSIDRLALEWTPETPSSDVRQALESLTGIGPWTSAIVAQRALGDADAVIVGDYHLPHIVAFNLAGERRATDERMLELLEPYRGHRGRAVRLLAMGGRHAPKRAPGRRLRDIRAI